MFALSVLLTGLATAASPADLGPPIQEQGQILATPVLDPAGTTWHYALDPSVNNDPMELTGGDWVYIGQHSYPLQWDVSGGTVQTVDLPPQSVETRRQEMILVDDLGREWAFAGPNTAFDVAEAVWGQSADEDSPTGVDPAVSTAPELDQYQPYSADLTTWVSTLNCDPGAGNGPDLHVWNSESRTVSSYASWAQEGSVLVQTG